MIDDRKADEMLMLIGKTMRRGIARKIESGTALGEGAMIGFLANCGQATAGEIAEFLGVGSGRVANLLKTTEKKGLVERRRHESDGRKLCVTLTEAGKACAESTTNKMKRNILGIAETLGEEDFDELLRLLKKLSDFSGGEHD